MKVTVTPDELMNRGLWLQAVSLLGIGQAVNDGRVKGGTLIELTGKQAQELGIVTGWYISGPAGSDPEESTS
jgi:hypothetical protein